VKKSFNFLILLLFAIIFSDLYSQIQESQANKEDFKTTKEYYENLIKDDAPNDKEVNNWIKRWLWRNRDGFMPIQNDEDFIRTANSKSNQNQAQKGWSPLGPINFPPSFDPYSGHGIGRINCIAFHPTNKDIIYVGAASGGVWKTENYGKNWRPLTDDLASITVSHIAIDPVIPSLVYFASGDYDGNTGPFLGIFKSNDSGENWTQTSLNKNEKFKNSRLKKIIINPKNTKEILTFGFNGVWKSTDAGMTWVHNETNYVQDAAIAENGTNEVYLIGRLNDSNPTGIKKSIDFGTTWDTLITVLAENASQVSRYAITISKVDPNYLYVVSASNNGGFNSFYNSKDAGKSWTKVSSFEKTENILGFYGGGSDDKSGQGSYNLVLIADPKDKNKVHFGGTNIWTTNNAGANWELVSYWVNCFGKSIHADHHYASYNPLDSQIYFANDGGIYRTKEILPGSKKWMDSVDKFYGEPLPNVSSHKFPTVWENISDGLAITQFYKLGLSKNNPNYVTAGSQDNSCFYFNSDSWSNYITNWDGMSTLIDHDDPKVIYGIWQGGGLCRSDDGGKKMYNYLTDTLQEKLGENGLWVTPIDMNPIDSKTLIIGLRNLWQSKDKGDTWRKLTDYPKMYNADTTRVVYPGNIDIVKYSYSDSLYFSISSYKSNIRDTANKKDSITKYGFWITKDGGENWLNIENIPDLNFDKRIQSIEYDKLNPNVMWAVVNNKLYNTTSGGASWTEASKTISNSGYITDIAQFQKSAYHTIFAATKKGVFYTNDTMSNWELYNLNLPNVEVSDIKIQELSNKLYVSTYGRGIWQTDITDEINSVESKDKSDYTFQVSPNPSNGSFAINFKSEINLSQETELMLLDVLGRKIWSGKVQNDGKEINQNLNINLENGVYYLRLISNGKEFAKKIMIKK